MEIQKTNRLQKDIKNKCTGKGEWSSCLAAVHYRRDETRKRALESATKKGHILSPFNVMNMAQCLKCGRWISCPNILAPTAAKDIVGAAFDYQCDSHLEGGYTHSRDKYPESPTSYKTVF